MIFTSNPGSVSPSTLPSIINQETGQIKMRNRISSASELASTFQALFISDFQASRARALVQSEVDGNPPYSESEDRKFGMGGRTNVNWGYLTQSQQDVEEPYISLFESIDVFGTTPSDYGSELERNRNSQIIAEEVTRMIKNWPDWPFTLQMTVHLFTMFGVSFTFREDQYDWRWKVYDLSFLKMPRRTRACINDVDIVTCKVEMLPSQLYRKIENEEAAEKAGWNVSAVKAAMKSATQKAADTSNPQEMERTYKDQDYFTGLSATTVDIVHGWVRECDGTVTHIIARYDGVGEFLYKCEGLYQDMSQLVTAYTYGVGSNGDFYAIRGNAWRGHNGSASLNMLTCKFLDQACFAATPHIQASSEDAVIDQMIRPRGPYNIVDQGTSFPEIPHVPFQQSLIPAIQQVQSIFAMRTRSPGAAMKFSNVAKTAEEVRSQNEIEGRLNAASVDLFFNSWKNDFREVVRRACNPKVSAAHPGGKEIFEFRKRCLKRGVPIEAIYAVDIGSIEINRGIGKGSAQDRRASFGALMPVMGQFDQEGQRILLRQFTASYTDTQFARLLVPDDAGSRPPVDLQIANMENSLMELGKPAQIEPNQDHVVHVGAHLAALSEINGALADVQIELDAAIQQMFPVWQHATEHMQFISPQNPLYPEFKAALEQIGEVVINGQKHLDAEARKAQRAAGEQVDESGATPGVSRQAVEAQTMLELQKKQQDLQFDAERHRQEMAFKDAKNAQDLRQKIAEAALKRQNKPEAK